MFMHLNALLIADPFCFSQLADRAVSLADVAQDVELLNRDAKFFRCDAPPDNITAQSFADTGHRIGTGPGSQWEFTRRELASGFERIGESGYLMTRKTPVDFQ